MLLGTVTSIHGEIQGQTQAWSVRKEDGVGKGKR